MKTAESKSTHSQHHSDGEKASGGRDRPFFSEAATGQQPFFTASPLGIQTKPAKAASFFQASQALQRMPAFESDADPQVQPKTFLQRQEDTAPEGDDEADTETNLQTKPMGAAAAAPDDGEETGPPQAKLTIGKPNDRFEREADAVADRVVASKNSSSPVGPVSQPIQRLPQVQRQTNDGSTANSNVARQLNSSQGSGSSLDGNTRQEMESAFGADFSSVRVHTDNTASQLSQSLGARAFTHGSDIYFNEGEYSPDSSAGKHLLAHELTHTVQQGKAIQRQTSNASPNLQMAPGASPQAAVSSEVVDVSASIFQPSEKVKTEIAAQGKKGLEVRVILRGVTSEGRIKIRLDSRGNYQSLGRGSMLLLNDWAKQMGQMYINFSVKNNNITGGFASFTKGGGRSKDWLKVLKKNSAYLGGLGLNIGQLPKPVNSFENGKLTLGVNELKVVVGGYVDAKFNLLLENTNKPKIDATADIDVQGLAKGTLSLDNSKDKLAGQVSLAISFKAFNGEAQVKYNPDGTVDINGKAAYSADKLSGEISFVATDTASANQFTKDAISAAGGKEKVQDAPPPAPVPAPKEGKKKRSLAATGQLAFNLTTWFAGTVNVVVDGKGQVTVIGKIAPPAEIILFEQKDWEKELISFEAKAYYGVPLVGNLNLFANISLHALAKLGPAKLYNIEILGTYSTDPSIQKNIQISGSLNISAYAGLRLRAEGGAGVELVGHDLKFGVGLNADLGVKAYADARPTIGYRDPGVFFISGTLEMVAQPTLGLGGDFFIELDSPWWSPAPDKKWLWPLFSKEWPLGDPIGLNASLKEYELGSGKVPEVELKQPQFDPSKFMTSMVDNKLPNKSGAKGEGKGTFKDDGSVPKSEVKPKQAGPKPKDAKLGQKGTSPQGGKSAQPNPKGTKDQTNMQALANAAKMLNAMKTKEPFSSKDLNKELAKVKSQNQGISSSIKEEPEKWLVSISTKDRKKATAAFKKSQQATDTQSDNEVGDIVKFTARDKEHKLWVQVKNSKGTVLIASNIEPVETRLKVWRQDAIAQKNNGNNQAITVLQEIGRAEKLLSVLNGDIRKAVALVQKEPERFIAVDQIIENNEDLLANSIKKIEEMAFETPSGPDYPRKPAPGIGNIARHGKKVSSNREEAKIWWTESEHILPFAAGKSLWSTTTDHIPVRNRREDKNQTTIMIYKGAADDKTRRDREVIAHFKTAIATLDLRAKVDTARIMYEAGNPDAKSHINEKVIGPLLEALQKARDDAASRTVKAIRKENQTKEPGFGETNAQRRAEPPNKETPTPSGSDVFKVAKEQYNDVLRLVTEQLHKENL